MKESEKILFENNFVKIDDVFYLTVTNGKFILEEEIKLTEKYTARPYTYYINSTKSTGSGLIYTDNLECFSVTLLRILHHFINETEKTKNHLTEIYANQAIGLNQVI